MFLVTLQFLYKTKQKKYKSVDRFLSLPFTHVIVSGNKITNQRSCSQLCSTVQ